MVELNVGTWLAILDRDRSTFRRVVFCTLAKPNSVVFGRNSVGVWPTNYDASGIANQYKSAQWQVVIIGVH